MIPHLATYVPRWTSGLFPDILWHVPTEERVAFLTFDDGPTTALTQRILGILERFNAGATFFLMGENAASQPGLVRQMIEAGHTVGNHTYTHPNAWITSPSQIVVELDRTTSVLEHLSGSAVRFMRPPYGRFTPGIRKWCRVRRQRLVMWDVMPGDFYPTSTAHGIERHLLQTTRTGSIVVLHDNPKAAHSMPQALEHYLRALSADGWRFDALPGNLPL